MADFAKCLDAEKPLSLISFEEPIPISPPSNLLAIGKMALYTTASSFANEVLFFYAV